MTGRVTDAYTNIVTVKLFSQREREAGFAKSAMQEFIVTVYRQMRLASAFEIVNHSLSMGLIACTAGATLWLWSQGQVSIGAVAAATAMALRLNGVSHWVMWEMSNLFEHIGTVQDGIATLARPVAVTDRADAGELQVRFALQHDDPFTLVLVVPETRRAALPGGHDAFDPHAGPVEQRGKLLLIAGRPGQGGENIGGHGGRRESRDEGRFKAREGSVVRCASNDPDQSSDGMQRRDATTD